MIEFENVSKAFGAVAAVDRLNLVVENGSICALVGPSGSGKSTLLRLVNRLVEPTAGRIRLAGVDIATLAPVTLRRRIGYVIQSIGLFPHWTVARNIATVPVLLGWPSSQITARVQELLELVGLEPDRHADRYPDELSGGQQQRVGVARALAARPEILLMDEPFGAVDPPTRRSLQDSLLGIQEQTGTTILIVTHDVDEAIRVGDRIAVMDAGRLLQTGTPAALLADPADAEVRRFFGGPLLGLRMLEALHVGERADFSSAAETGAANVAPIAANATLRTALARMIAEHRVRLPVIDPETGRSGVIALADMVR